MVLNNLSESDRAALAQNGEQEVKNNAAGSWRRGECIYEVQLAETGVALAPGQSAKLQPNFRQASNLNPPQALCQVGAKWVPSWLLLCQVAS